MQEGGEPAAEPAMKTDPTTNSTESVIQTPSICEIVTSVVLKNYDRIYNSIENDLLKDWKHSEILITIIAIWIFYRFIKSIDCYKIRHMFTRRKTTVIDPNIMKRMEQYWIDKLTTGIETCNGKLPDEPWDEQKIINTISELAKREESETPVNIKIRHPYKSEADCNSESDKIAKQANGMFFKSNPLHFDIFDGVCKMEAEVIQMCNNLYHGGDSGCGIVDTSEGDCIRNAALSYKKWAKECKGVSKPNIVALATFDPSLERACLMLDIEFRRVSVGDSVRVNFDDITSRVDSNTVAIFCSAPDQYFGVTDPIENIAQYAHENTIGCHVDCNYSSFFMNVGCALTENDNAVSFKIDGITSIGVSLSRYALGPCGTAVLLYKTRKLRRYQYFSTTKWNGGIYFTPNLTGSRYGSAIAAAWTKILATGLNNYKRYAKEIIEATLSFKEMLLEFSEIEIITPQSFSIIAFRLKQSQDTYELADYLRNDKYAVVNTINPAAISYTITNANKSFCTKMKESISNYLKLKKENCKIYVSNGVKEFYENKDVLRKFVEMKHHAPYLANIKN